MPPEPRTLVLGLGNDLLGDDGFGPHLARELGRRLDRRPGVAVEEAAAAGLRLLDLLGGFDRALIVDVVVTGLRPAGTLAELGVEDARAGRALGGSHQCDLASVLAFGRRLGLPLPAEVTVLVAEAREVTTIHEGVSAPLRAALEPALGAVRRWLDGGRLGVERLELGAAAPGEEGR